MGMTFQTSFKRYEVKYMLSVRQQEVLLEGMQEYMEPDVYGKTVNCSIYYDNDQWDLARRSIAKPVYKEKLRVRSYGIPKAEDLVFIELKKKFDGVVYKRRTTIRAEWAEACLTGKQPFPEQGQIVKEIEWFQHCYRAEPRVFIAYDRTSFAGKENPELRITFDRDIRFRESALELRAGDYGTALIPEGQVLMEIKIPGAAPVWLARLLSKEKIRPSSFSKYGYYYKNHIVNNESKETSYHVRIHSYVTDFDPVVSDLHSRVACSRLA